MGVDGIQKKNDTWRPVIPILLWFRRFIVFLYGHISDFRKLMYNHKNHLWPLFGQSGLKSPRGQCHAIQVIDIKMYNCLVIYYEKKLIWIFDIILLCSKLIRDGTGESESQIVRTPLRGFCDCMGKPDRIVFSLKSPIDLTVF